MIEILLLLAAGLLGWFLARRQKTTEPPAPIPKKHISPTFKDKIDDITSAKTYPDDSDDDLATWLDDHFKGKRK